MNNLGMGAAARGAPDGYTPCSSLPHVPYDQTQGFLRVGARSCAPNVLLAHPRCSKIAKHLAEFIKTNPGRYKLR